MLRSGNSQVAIFGAALTGASCTRAAAAQLGARLADEWAVTLESGQRIGRMEIDRVVDTIGLECGEIGAGTGVLSAPNGERVGPDGLEAAVEVDPGFPPMILDNARRAGVSNVRAVLGEFEDPNIPRNDIDVAFFHEVLHHVQERAACL